MHPIDKEPLPLSTFHMDHLGPMPSTNKNYVHILAIIDAFTKFVWLFPTKSVTADETLSKLKVVTGVFGNPRRIIADKGGAFRANIFNEFRKEQDIELILCTTGVPRGNGQVERIHRITISALSKLSIENPQNWFEYVEDVQNVLNNTIQRAIQTTPFQLMFGVPMNRKDTDIRRIIEDEIIQEFNNERDKIREMARDSISKIQEENRRSFNRKRKEATTYEAKDLIAINKTQFSTAAKLKPKFLGPYEVTKVKEYDRYDVEKVGIHEGPNRTSTSADNMKRWPMLNNLQQYGGIKMMRRCSGPNRYTAVHIEGNVGAGKTTLLQFLANYDFIKIHEEPVSK